MKIETPEIQFGPLNKCEIQFLAAAAIMSVGIGLQGGFSPGLTVFGALCLIGTWVRWLGQKSPSSRYT